MADIIHQANCGYFDPMSLYMAEDMNYLFKNLISNGIYLSDNGDISADLMVENSLGLNVKVRAGQGYFANKWFILNADCLFQVPTADTAYDRIDSVLVQIDTINKVGNLVYRSGTPAEIPVEPDINGVSTLSEYRIANILVEANAIAVSSITDLRGTPACPWIISNIPDTMSKVVNVVQKGVRNDGSLTDLSLALNQSSDTIYYFPKGTYKILGFKFISCHNVTIFAPNAVFEFGGTAEDSTHLFYFDGCTNCKVIGGVYDGKSILKTGITFLMSDYNDIRNVEVKNIGCQTTQDAAGLRFVGDCSNSRLVNVNIHNVQAGVYDGNYIFASGISINTSKNRDYSQNIVIDSPVIYEIGTAQYPNATGGTLSIDGDGIYLVQRPTYVAATDMQLNTEEEDYQSSLWGAPNGTYYYYDNRTNDNENRRAVFTVEDGNISSAVVEIFDDIESTIKILNPYITNCAKRAIKVSTRCVDIIGGIIDISSSGAAVEYQYPRNSTVRSLHIHNQGFTCLSIYGGDGVMSVENCYFSGNGTINGIALYRENGSNIHYNKGGENLIISGCEFENLALPIVAGIDGASLPVSSDSIVIRDCTIGHFSGNVALSLSPNRFSSLKKLKITDINFKYGNSIDDVFSANNTFYCTSVSNPSLIYLGTASNHVNPSMSMIIDIDSLEDDFYQVFNGYTFNANKLYLGGNTALTSDVLEHYEFVKPTVGGHYVSQTFTGADLTADILSDFSIQITGTEQTSTQYVYIPIEEFTANSGVEYRIKISSNAVYSSGGLTVSLHKGISGGERLGSEIAVNNYQKSSTLTVSAEGTAKSIGIKLRSNTAVISNTLITVSFSTTSPTIKGMIDVEKRLTALEERVTALEALNS